MVRLMINMADINVFVYPNEADEDAWASSIATVLRDSLDFIISNTYNIDSRSVDIRYEYPGVDKSGRYCDNVSDANKSDFYQQFDGYIDCHHPNEIGCHLGVSKTNLGGLADGGDGFGSAEGAFVERRVAVTGGNGTDGGNSFYENIAIQEMLHPFLDNRVPEPWDIRSSGSGHEHDLGTRTPAGKTRPMATSYYDDGDDANRDPINSHGEHGNCANINISHTGYIQNASPCTRRAIDATMKSDFNSNPSSSPNERWGETWIRNVNDSWQTFYLIDEYEYPIVLAKPLSFNGSHPAHMRFRNVDLNSDTVEGKIEEWDYLDGNHVQEEVGVLAINEGEIHNDGNGRHLQTAVQKGVETTWQTVYYHSGGFANKPIVIAQPQTIHGGDAIVTRIKDITKDSFKIRLQEQETKYRSNNGHNKERIGWFATPPATAYLDGVQYEVDRLWLDDDWYTLDFKATYTDPVFVADMQTFNGDDPCSIRYKNLTSSSVDLRIQEETSSDDETSHTTERVGYFVREAASIG